MNRAIKVGVLLLFIFFLLTLPLQAQQNVSPFPGIELAQGEEGSPATMTVPEDTSGYPDLTSQALVLVFLALLPFLVMLLTSFLKMVIALSLLRNALGVQQIPPNQAINGIALILSLYVMYPTGVQMYNEAKQVMTSPLPTQLFSPHSAAAAFTMINASKEPLRQFLIRNTNKKTLDSFYKLAKKSFPQDVSASIKTSDFIVVTPSFIMSQIDAAFKIGVLIYLPFFVIDLVTSNILLAMQMMMLSPLSISLPLKLLLIVMLDGWTVLVQGLVLSFK